MQNEPTVDNEVVVEEAPLSKEKKRKADLSPEERAERKQRNAKKAIAIVLIVVLCLGLISGITAAANGIRVNSLKKTAASFSTVEYTNQLVPVKDADGYYVFTTDDDFKVLQLTDVHIGGGWMSKKKDVWAMNAVASMITAEKPDLVIVTGDIAYPVPFQAGTFNNLSATKAFAATMEQLGVYWTFTFGNHDTEIYSYYDRQEICDWYAEQDFKYCLFNQGKYIDEDFGYGNNIIKVKNTAGIVTQALVTIDSHSYTDGDYLGIQWKYDSIHQNQVEWYADEIDKINAANIAVSATATAVKSLAFFHIPIREYRVAWAEYVDNGNKDTANVQYVYGVMGESDNVNSVGEQTYGVYCGIYEDSLLEVGLEKGLQGMFCGHDHYNNFSLVYKGIRLSYGMSIDYLAYSGIWKKTEQRGCTLITVSPDGSFDSVLSNYYSKDEYVAENKQ